MQGGCTVASGAIQSYFRDAIDQAGLLMLVGRFMRLEAEYALGNKGRAACRQAMDFVVETSTFEQEGGGSREGDRAPFPVAYGAHAGFMTLAIIRGG